MKKTSIARPDSKNKLPVHPPGPSDRSDKGSGNAENVGGKDKPARGGKRKGAGRKPRPLDLEEVEKLYVMQCTDEEVAAWFGVKVRTIERRRLKDAAFGAAVERGRAKGRISLRRTLFNQATNGSAAASIFLAKNLLGYRDVRRNEHSGPDGAPIPLDAGVDLSRLSTEEVEQLATLLDKSQPSKGNSGESA